MKQTSYVNRKTKLSVEWKLELKISIYVSMYLSVSVYDGPNGPHRLVRLPWYNVLLPWGQAKPSDLLLMNTIWQKSLSELGYKETELSS